MILQTTASSVHQYDPIANFANTTQAPHQLTVWIAMKGISSHQLSNVERAQMWHA